MKILILGGDGYLGWPTAMYFASRGHDVAIVDNLSKRLWEAKIGVAPLHHIPTLQRRVRLWNARDQGAIALHVGDVAHNHRFIYRVFDEFRADAIIHYAEQPSAPFSMSSREYAVDTQANNVLGTLNTLFAMKRFVPAAHLVKLGTMGEYGTPNIDIEEGWLDVEHNGRRDRMLFPKRPGSFYHASKVADSVNIEFACRAWGIRATDLNQGVVYGIDTDETALDPELTTSFHYDEVFGTVLNRFVVQAVVGMPLTVYGGGKQQRAFLNIRDTLRCVELATLNPPDEGEFRVFNQFTETFSLLDLTGFVQRAGASLGMAVSVEHLDNPRVELEEHYYNPKHQTLLTLGLEPHLLTEKVVRGMIERVQAAKTLIDPGIIQPTIRWQQSAPGVTRG
jgi:UDP-sulfoquinovose synthase